VALIAAPGNQPGNPLSVGDLHMDPMTRKATRGDRPITLSRGNSSCSSTERHADQVVTRTMLLENVWTSFRSADRTWWTAHQQLRQKIDAGIRAPLLRTVRMREYMVTAGE